MFSEFIKQPDDRWIHSACSPLDIASNGPFTQLEDKSLMAIDGNVIRTSSDGGKRWSEGGSPIDPDMIIGQAGHRGQFLRTQDGTIIIVFLDATRFNFSWNKEIGGPNPDCRQALYSIRSTDGGKTWTDRQELLGGYNADFMGLLETKDGSVVATVEHLFPEHRRWLVCSFVSKDAGESWRCGNWIDLGGHGHHDGAVEPAATELSDGRLLMLIRTSLGRFWEAYSEDGGQYWRTIKPSGIDASSAPAWMLRLRSGRIAVVWNQSKPEGADDWPKRFSDDPIFEFPASTYREELSAAISSDDGETWSHPLVIARQPGGQLAYPYLHERSPGILWVFTRYTFDGDYTPIAPLAVELQENDIR